MEYKFVELMSLQYTRSPEDIVQHQITYRYNAMKVGPSTAKILEHHVPNADKVKSSYISHRDMFLSCRTTTSLPMPNVNVGVVMSKKRVFKFGKLCKCVLVVYLP